MCFTGILRLQLPQSSESSMNPSSVSAAVVNARERPLPPIPVSEPSPRAMVTIETDIARPSSREDSGNDEEIHSSTERTAVPRPRGDSTSVANTGPSAVGTSSFDEGSLPRIDSRLQGNPLSSPQVVADVFSDALSPPAAYQTDQGSQSPTTIRSRDLSIESRPDGDSSGSDSLGDVPLLSRTSSRYRRRPQRTGRANSTEQSQVAIPRWQPDAEVTLCPICRSQFSKFLGNFDQQELCVERLTRMIGFFVRKHHCRSASPMP